MDRVRDPAEIDLHDAVQLAERFAGAIPPQPTLNPGIRDHQLERGGAVGGVDPGGNGRRFGNVEAGLDHLGAALAAKIGHRGEPGGVSATDGETGSGRSVGPGQGGADTAARTGDKNGAGIPHPFICIAFGRENIDFGRLGIVGSASEGYGISSTTRPRWALCHEHHRSKRRCGTVREMKEGPSGSAIRSLIPSHRKLLWSKVTVVSVAETPGR